MVCIHVNEFLNAYKLRAFANLTHSSLRSHHYYFIFMIVNFYF
jgi:hypothetical protein